MARRYLESLDQSIAVMADEETVTGFLLAGIGERSKKAEPNFFITEKDQDEEVVAKALQEWLDRKDIAIVMIAQTTAQALRHII